MFFSKSVLIIWGKPFTRFLKTTMLPQNILKRVKLDFSNFRFQFRVSNFVWWFLIHLDTKATDCNHDQNVHRAIVFFEISKCFPTYIFWYKIFVLPYYHDFWNDDSLEDIVKCDEQSIPFHLLKRKYAIKYSVFQHFNEVFLLFK